MNTISSKQIAWDLPKKSATAEISSFGKGFNFEQIFPDACDTGFMIISEKTGTITIWYLKEIVKNDLKETIEWICEPIPEHLKKHPELKGWILHIFND